MDLYKKIIDLDEYYQNILKDELFYNGFFCKYHHFIKRKDYRTIDLLDDLYNFFSSFKKEIKLNDKKCNLDKTYANYCLKILEDKIKCTKLSRAEKYRNKAIILCNKIIQQDDYDDETIIDITKITISLLRKFEKNEIDDLDFDLFEEDLDYIRNTRINDFIIYKNILQKPVKLNYPESNFLYVYWIINTIVYLANKNYKFKKEVI